MLHHNLEYSVGVKCTRMTCWKLLKLMGCDVVLRNVMTRRAKPMIGVAPGKKTWSANDYIQTFPQAVWRLIHNCPTCFMLFEFESWINGCFLFLTGWIYIDRYMETVRNGKGLQDNQVREQKSCKDTRVLCLKAGSMTFHDIFVFFLSSRFFLGAKDLATDFNMRPPRKINMGFTKDSRNYFFIREEWPFQEKGI